MAASLSSGGGEYGHRRNSSGMTFPMGVEEESSMTIAREFLSRLVSAVARGWDVSSRQRKYGTCVFPRVVVIPAVLSNLNICITKLFPLPHLIRFMFPVSLSLSL